GGDGAEGHVNNGLASFTGASASFQASDVGKELRIADVIYKITAFGGSTAVTLDRNYAGTTATSAAWALYNDLDEHSLETSIGGLVDGQTYYVTSFSTSATTIQLAATSGGSAITFDGSHRLGTHAIGFVPVDLDLPSTTLAAATVAGATVIKVASISSFTAGDQIVVDEAGNRE